VCDTPLFSLSTRQPRKYIPWNNLTDFPFHIPLPPRGEGGGGVRVLVCTAGSEEQHSTRCCCSPGQRRGPPLVFRVPSTNKLPCGSKMRRAALSLHARHAAGEGGGAAPERGSNKLMPTPLPREPPPPPWQEGEGEGALSYPQQPLSARDMQPTMQPVLILIVSGNSGGV
jgi:hypothetical protein